MERSGNKPSRFFFACFAARGGSTAGLGKRSTGNESGDVGPEKGKEKAASNLEAAVPGWGCSEDNLPSVSPGDASFQCWLQDRFDLRAKAESAVCVGDAIVVLGVRR